MKVGARVALGVYIHDVKSLGYCILPPFKNKGSGHEIDCLSAT